MKFLTTKGENMLIELLRKRRSIRRFTDHPISPEKRNLLLEAALRSPSSKSLYPCEFIVVEDKERMEQLAKAKPHGSALLKNAPLGIVVCADTTKSDVWIEDASVAALILHLEAEDLGLGSCWVQIRNRPHDEQQSAQEYVAQVLNLPEHIMVEAVIGIGYPAEEKKGHPAEKLLHDQVSFEQFGQKKAEP